MAKTKQTERKQHGSGLPRAEFPTTASESEDSPNSPEQVEAAAPRVAEAPREEPEVQGARPRGDESTARASQQPLRQIVLPRHTAVSSMDSSFINYF